MKLYNVSDVAKEFGVDKSNFMKLLKNLNITSVKQRTTESGNQMCSFLNEGDYSIVKAYRGSFSEGKSGVPKVYIVVPDAEARPNRVKVGYSSDFGKRLSTYKTICPNVTTLRTYDLDRSVEPMFLNIAKKHGRMVGVEVFDITDFEVFLTKCDTIYDVYK